ncbi:HNH endonuclease [Schleiferilactobacillus shenzhenensis]|nr:HNH endonuclease [Schleiferilactobacillus shenzhenensis]
MAIQKLVVVNGRPTLVDYSEPSRQERDRNYSSDRRQNRPEYTRFYSSSIWRKTRAQVLLRDNGECQHCGMPATMVDHIVPSADDWTDRLDPDNLQALCDSCHHIKTDREERAKQREVQRAMTVTVVCGYPGSGRASYVQQHEAEHDIIIDKYALMQSLSGRGKYDVDADIDDYAELAYELLLRKVKVDTRYNRVWIILAGPDTRLDSLLVSHNVEHILIDTDKSTCMDRLSKLDIDSDVVTELMRQVDVAKATNQFDKFIKIK